MSSAGGAWIGVEAGEADEVTLLLGVGVTLGVCTGLGVGVAAITVAGRKIGESPGVGVSRFATSVRVPEVATTNKINSLNPMTID